MVHRAIHVALISLFVASGACAQSTTTAAATLSTTPIQAYQDRLIDGNLPPDAQETAEQAYNREGLPRSYSLETTFDRRGVGSTTDLYGLRATAFFDTLYWGSFSGQLGLQQGKSQPLNGSTQSSQQVLWSIRQQGMPLDGGWQLDNALGQISLPVPELARNSLRLGLPTAGMLGLSSQWRQAAGLKINAAVGQSGGFSGFPVARFDTTGGHYAYLSFEDRKSFGSGKDASRWQYGATLATAQNVPSGLTFSNTGQGRINAQSLYAAAQRQWPGSQGSSGTASTLQANVLHSQNSGVSVLGQPNASTQGAWLDGSFNLNGHANQWGVFYLEPNLSWLEAPVSNDLQGGYWRHSWSSRQWNSESNLELLSPVKGNVPSGFFASQALRYQYSTMMSLGGSISLRRYNSDGHSLQLYTQWLSSWGSTRLQTEFARSEPADTLVRIQLEHDFNAMTDLRLSTSLSADREKRNGIPMRGYGLALNADWQLANDLSLTSSLQSRFVDQKAQYNLNMGLSWRMAPQWSLNATVFGVQGNPQAGSLVQSPLTVLSNAGNRLQDKGVFISLRFSEAAGSTRVPMGGSVGSAAGSIQGVIFLDENGNGKQEASERGAAQVTVQLDGRFSVNTDAQGRFEFPYVSAGQHTISVVSDNLPLPWAMPSEGKQSIRVNTRDQTRVMLGAIKN
jgi:SdrD B-like domain